MNHSPEPWKVVPENELGFCACGPGIEDAKENDVVDTRCSECSGADERLNEANAKRIVACVNFCKGFGNRWLEANRLSAMPGRREFNEQGQ